MMAPGKSLRYEKKNWMSLLGPEISGVRVNCNLDSVYVGGSARGTVRKTKKMRSI